MSLRELRRLSGLTQERLAYLLSVDRRRVIRWEQGTSDIPASFVPKLAWALRCEERDVLEAVIRDRQTA